MELTKEELETLIEHHNRVLSTRISEQNVMLLTEETFQSLKASLRARSERVSELFEKLCKLKEDASGTTP